MSTGRRALGAAVLGALCVLLLVRPVHGQAVGVTGTAAWVDLTDARWPAGLGVLVGWPDSPLVLEAARLSYAGRGNECDDATIPCTDGADYDVDSRLLVVSATFLSRIGGGRRWGVRLGPELSWSRLDAERTLREAGTVTDASADFAGLGATVQFLVGPAATLPVTAGAGVTGRYMIPTGTPERLAYDNERFASQLRLFVAYTLR